MHDSRRWRRVAVAVVLLLVVVGTAACADHTNVSGNRVLVIGDSLLEDAEPQVTAALERDGWQPIVNGIGGLPIQAWKVGARRYVEKFHPEVAVVELGTNNCAKSPCEDIGAYIDAVMHELTNSADVVFWLNAQDVPIDHPVHADYVNRSIADAAVRWPNMVVVDMDAHFAGHTEWRLPDGLHFNEEGIRQLGELIRRALHDASPAAKNE